METRKPETCADLCWSNYSFLEGRIGPLFHGKSRLVKYYDLARLWHCDTITDNPKNQTGILTLIIDNPKSSDKGRRESKPTFSRIAKVFFGAGFKDFWHFHADTSLGFHADSQH